MLAALRGAQRPPRVRRRRPVVAVVLLIVGASITVIGGLVQLAAYGTIYRGGQSAVGVSLIIAGPVLMQIGAVFLAPGILRRAAEVASRWGPGARLSTRDVARNPGRSGPALAAIMSCVFVATFVMSLQASLEINSTRTYTYTAPLNTAVVSLNVFEEEPAFEYVVQSTGPEVAAALDASFPSGQARLLSSVEQPFPGFTAPGEATDGAAVAPALPYPRIDPAALCPTDADRTGSGAQEFPADIRCPTPYYLDVANGARDDHIWVGDVDDLAAILGMPVSAQSRQTLAAGGAVSTYDEYLADDRIRLDWLTALNTSEEPTRSLTLAGSVQKPEHPLPYAIFMLPSTADAVGLDYRPTVAVSSLDAPPTVAELDQAQAALAAVSQDMSLTVEAGPDAYGATWSWALLALTAIIALVTATITIGLGRADGHRDSAVLRSLGASPWVRRAFGFWQAVVVVGLGSLIGVLLGLMPSLALSLTRDALGVSILPFAPPWLQLTLMVLALPALVAVGAALTAGGKRTGFSNRAVVD
ncbi:ABC transporter permease [Cryobacterium melibiosiphilum]|uniref:ABC transporter permease n=1 Tax=Cryobacterium melibiosiphilum TaxID=995039 RepID=A0A3A5MLE0_9MICO|nr:ABC transporter permease [Cryobacterium melibiosiphilum]